MKTKLINGWKWLLGLFMGILGLSGCDKIFPIRCEYGCPNADFKLIGDVKDANGKGIEGIRVVFRPDRTEEDSWENDTLYTDAKGHFERERLKYDWPDGAERASVKFEDVDGSAHGSYKTKVLQPSELTVEQTKKGDGSWYAGVYTISANVTLEEED